MAEFVTGPVSLVQKLSLRSALALPGALIIAFAVHYGVAGKQPAAETSSYRWFLGLLFGAAMLAIFIQAIVTRSRSWIVHIYPIIAVGVLTLAIWDIITTGLHWLPLPYFPGPAGVLAGLLEDRKELLEHTWYSLILLLGGYLIGVVVALITGVCIGWFAEARYWGMPLLKLVGPIPATAWIPLAMVLSPSPRLSAVGLIALAVWFPVTMLTASGISNTRASYIDVARTLGAGRAYLIFHVAIPAAMPSIFIGLFMGLGASFLTLVGAETVGVKAGLGYYVSWKQGWAEYGKVYAALVIMAAFFSTIMTILFKVRDRVLVWQKGIIKW
jgi:NitT/TauT family transport system permease protein